MGITLKDIAAMAGVHKSTVDKVIHNRPGVSDAKRQEIRRLLEEYNYESNPLAKALNYQKNKGLIAVVLPVVDALPELKEGMELVRQDFSSFNFEIEYHEVPFPDGKAQARCLHKLCEQGVSGVVLNPIEDPAVTAVLEALSAAKIPVVTVNSDLAPRFCFVGQDMEQAGHTAARLAALLLNKNGTVGVISSRAMRAVVQRREAFAQYLSENWPGIRIAETLDIQENPEDAYRAASEFLSRRPDLDALYITCGCVPDLCRALRDRNLRLPVICYERYPAIVELVRGGEIACTISGGLRNQGRLAMRLLFEYLIYDRLPDGPTVFTKNEILFRENI